MLRKTMLLMAAVLLTLLGTVGTAHADVRDKIIRDCTDDDVLQGDYSPAALRDARKHLVGDAAEYSDCSSILRRAEDAKTRAATTAPSTPGAASVPGALNPNGGASARPLTAQTPEDRAALDAAAQTSDQPITVAGSKLLAGAAPLREGYRANNLPDSLIVALVLLAAAGVALSLPPIRRRLLTLRRRK